ncbi:hypothetical protein B9Z55_028494 [Caenorhabditis nigoni]|uniref:Uncharacterized protein n=1 Tax=Caenorhabditis nigoni TaxID=1611254 RepID=A0A2G5SBE1_9PELO|nr:hypothetical protein B9Z55_028494 [Caenorhabditis nigoni]
MSNSANSSSQPKRRRGNVREPTHLSLLRELNEDKSLVLSNFQDWANRVNNFDEKESLLKMIPDLESAHGLIGNILVSVEKKELSVPKKFSEFWNFFNGRFNKEQLAKHALIAGILKSIEGKMGEAEEEFKSCQNVEEPPAKKKGDANGNQINDASKAASISSIPIGNKIGQENQIRLSFAGTADNSENHVALTRNAKGDANGNQINDASKAASIPSIPIGNKIGQENQSRLSFAGTADNSEPQVVLTRNAKGAHDTDEKDFVSGEDLPKILNKIEKDLEGYGHIIKGFHLKSSAGSAEMAGRAERDRRSLLRVIRDLTNNFIGIKASEAIQELRGTIEKQPASVKNHWIHLVNAIGSIFDDVKTNGIQLDAILKGASNAKEVRNNVLEIPKILDTIEKLLEACEYSIKAFQVLHNPGSADIANRVEGARNTLLEFISYVRNNSVGSAATEAAQRMEKTIKEQTPLADKNWVYSANGIQTMFEDVKSRWNQIHAILKKRPSNSSTSSSIPATKQPAPGLNEMGGLQTTENGKL